MWYISDYLSLAIDCRFSRGGGRYGYQMPYHKYLFVSQCSLTLTKTIDSTFVFTFWVLLLIRVLFALLRCFKRLCCRVRAVCLMCNCSARAESLTHVRGQVRWWRLLFCFDSMKRASSMSVLNHSPVNNRTETKNYVSTSSLFFAANSLYLLAFR